MGVNCSEGPFRPFGGHHFGGESCPPTTSEVVPYSNS